MLWLLGSDFAWSAQESTYQFWTGNGAPGRAEYYLSLAEHALTASEDEFGPWRLTRFDRETPTLRARHATQTGEFDFQATTIWHKEIANPKITIIRQPLQYGLLGYRNFLIRRQDEDRFEALKSLDDLQGLTAGMGRDWPDAAILRANGLRVLEAPTFGALFPMLMAKRFDYIPLGVEEIEPTFVAYQDKYPNIVASESILMVYPISVHFMVCSCRPDLIERLQVGLANMVESGEMQRFFSEQKHAAIALIQQHWSQVYRLENTIQPQLVQSPNLEDASAIQ
ncbi:hypothetical protein QWI17_02260 [Gilvimarinus sp. SDUM040013]|uniref:Solute-binding protein family 3/N-terminal domain-containing protein n=1 Tax=Gilvimarinus gilvus TaxID=3058038 RepID=A0ABU4S1I5_9GAMM|nr:hypothetical protein [Gilvimarinus sp. SDUM040013]MDX6850241.1 hypothetical protein [Gilvimarinus sp. SDUM040013]